MGPRAMIVGSVWMRSSEQNNRIRECFVLTWKGFIGWNEVGSREMVMWLLVISWGRVRFVLWVVGDLGSLPGWRCRATPGHWLDDT